MFTENLKHLRQSHSISQENLSQDIQIPRTTLGDYERGKTEPNIVNLMKIAAYFKVSLDDILKHNLSNESFTVAENKQLKVLAVTVDNSEKQNIELVESKAEAGYLESFSNPEYIKDLPKMNIPGLSEKTYRAFTIQGDSMLPLESGSIIICTYLENLKEIKDHQTYIIVSKLEGLVYKRVINNVKAKKLQLVSDNSAYLPYEINYQDVDEIWAYKAHISFSDNKQLMEDMVQEKLDDIQKKVSDIHSRLS